MSRILCGVALALTVVGCGSGGGGGSGGQSNALFGGPLMFIGAQLRIYGSTDLQLAEFNNDGLPDLYYNSRLDSREDFPDLAVVLGSESELFGEEQRLQKGLRTSPADFNNDDTLDIFYFAAGDPDSRGFPNFEAMILPGNGDGTFAEPQFAGFNATEEFPPDDVAAADITGDGIEDLLALGYYLAEIVPYVNDGDGTFTAAPAVEVNDRFGNVVGEDLNNDTYDDLVYFGMSAVDTALSNGDGTFGSPSSLSTGGIGFLPALDDLDQDGYQDLVGFSNGEGIVAFLGEGDGSFAPELLSPTIPVFAGGALKAIADFNGDTVPDLVLQGTEASRGQVEPLLALALGQGDGTYDPDLVLIDTGEFGTVLTMDVDRDGNLDVLANIFNGANFLRPYFGNGDGTFREETSSLIEVDLGADMLTSTDPYGRQSARPLDIDADGNLDLAAQNSTAADDMSLFLGSGDGTFAPEQRVSLNGMFIRENGDLDGDGDVDFFGESMARFFSILNNYGNGDLRPLPLIPISLVTPSEFRFDHAFDLDQDDLPDPLFLFDNGDIRVLYGLGGMQFEPLVTVANIGEESLLETVDITGDGYPDLVSELFTVEPTRRFFVRPGHANRTFGPAVETEVALPTGPSVVTVFGGRGYYQFGDFNADGRTDFVQLHSPVEQSTERTIISLMRAEADGTFTYVQDSYVPFSSIGVANADLDLDGDSDLVLFGASISDLVGALQSSRMSVHALLTNDAGLFESAAGILARIGPLTEDFDADVTDITGDGTPDALVYSESLGLVVAVGQGDGTFGRPNYFQTGGGTEPVIGDFDNDGDSEFAAIIAAGGFIELLDNLLVQE